MLLKAEILRGISCDLKMIAIQLQICKHLISLRWWAFKSRLVCFKRMKNECLFSCHIKSNKPEITLLYSLLKVWMFESVKYSLCKFNAQHECQNAHNWVQGLQNPRLQKMIQASFPSGLLHMRFLYQVSQNIISCYMQLQGHTADA